MKALDIINSRAIKQISGKRSLLRELAQHLQFPAAAEVKEVTMILIVDNVQGQPRFKANLLEEGQLTETEAESYSQGKVPRSASHF